MKTDIDLLQPITARSVTCARCGTVFGCNRDGACWCMDEAFRMPMPAAGSGADCLCPDCLRAMAMECEV